MPHDQHCIGIDVAKNSLDVHSLATGQTRRFVNQPDGWSALVTWIGRREPSLVCLEATGGYEQPLVAFLQQRNIPVAVVNPRQIRDFARALNQLAKTDAIDARVIAMFAQRIGPPMTPATGENRAKLKALTARRRQVQEMITREKNRRQQTFDPAVREMIDRALDMYRQQLRQLEEQIARLAAEDETMCQRIDLLTSVPGVGATTAAVLVAELPELGRLNRQQIARLVGLAPTNRDSGTLRGKRTIGGGRGHVRRAVYMAALAGIRFNRRIADYYRRLVEAGKPKMLALLAAARKLLVILNTMVKNNTKWQPGP
jgi:transposase